MLKCLITQYFLAHGLQKTNQYIHWKLLPKIIFETYKHAVVVQLLCPTLCTPWTAAHQASLSLSISWSLPKFTSIESVMLSSLPSPAALFSFCPQSFPASGKHAIKLMKTFLFGLSNQFMLFILIGLQTRARRGTKEKTGK